MSSHKAVSPAADSSAKAVPPSGEIPLGMLLGDDDTDEAQEAEEVEAALLAEGTLRPLGHTETNSRVEDDDDGSTGLSVSAEADASARPFREDARVDRRIIEGMLRDRDTFIEQMEQEGFTQAAVLRRAAELGLSEALIRQVKGVAADLAGERPGRRPAPSSLGARTCLSCDRVFLSSGPGNRLCMRCRGGDAGLAQL
jgi:hypothetical protein